MRFLEKLSGFISKYMAVFVILVAAIALFQPWTFKWAAPQIAILLGIVMFGMGTTLRLRDFRLVFQRPKDVLVGAFRIRVVDRRAASCKIHGVVKAQQRQRAGAVRERQRAVLRGIGITKTAAVF